MEINMGRKERKLREYKGKEEMNKTKKGRKKIKDTEREG
jgi:hypothetical protein